MSKIHELSSVTTIPELDLFSVNPTQAVVERNVDVTLRPLAPVTGANFIEFRFPTPLDYYVLFHETYLRLKVQFKLKNKTGGEVKNEDWSGVRPVNNLLHSLFKQVELIIGDEEIVKGPQTYPYKAYLESLLGFSESSKKTNLSCALFETSYYVNPNHSYFGPAAEATDQSKGKVFDLMGRLHLDFTFQGKALLGGCVTGLKLTLNDPDFYMYYMLDGNTPSVDILDAQLELNCLKCYPHLVEAHNRALQKSTAKYPLTRCEVKAVTVPRDITSVHLDNIVQGLLPRRMFVCMVSNAAFNGNLRKDPFKFEDFNLNFIASYVDGVQIPSEAYKPDFQKGIYSREYLGLLRALNQNTTDSMIDFDKQKWKDTRCIFGFNYAPDMTNGMGDISHTSIQKRGCLGLALQFASALSSAINVILYCEYDTVIEIDANRQPILNYS
jgi:hypothetical protein